MATQAITRRTVLEMIETSKTNFEGRLPAGMTVERFMYGLATSVQKNPALQECDPKSVVLAAYEAAEVGCNLSPSLALGWIIPYGKSAQFQPSYRFFIQRAYETGAVAAFYAEVVYANDFFSREFAPKRTVKHLPPTDGNRGEPIGAYALVEFKDGHLDWEYVTKEQIERHRKASKMPDSIMWTKFWEEGWRKTPIRLLTKRLPMTNPGLEKLAELVNRDAESDADPVVPRTLEIEAGTALPQQQPKPTAVPAAPAAQPDGNGVLYFVGSLITEIRGQKLRRMFSAGEMTPLGLKIDGTRWTIPAANTEAFLQLCRKNGIKAQGVDESGQIISGTSEAEEEQEPWTNEPAPALFEDRP